MSSVIVNANESADTKDSKEEMISKQIYDLLMEIEKIKEIEDDEIKSYLSALIELRVKMIKKLMECVSEKALNKIYDRLNNRQ